MPLSLSQPLQLLGGLSAEHFMQRYWQRKPLLIRQAIPNFDAPIGPNALFQLAQKEDVQSRLITHAAAGWQLRQGPFKRRQLPAQTQPEWTLLVQGVDLHDDAAHALLQQFSFIPQARLDDLMISYASHGGGVGPHFDSYDVFLLQAKGTRRWRIGKQKNLQLQEGVPLRILQHFEAEQEWVLEPGDMLYLPPRYAHDGIAEGDDCMTYSIGFRAPNETELSSILFERLSEYSDDSAADNGKPHTSRLYQDAQQPPVVQSGAIPEAMSAFARQTLERALQSPHLLEQLLGEYLSEPKPETQFEEFDCEPACVFPEQPTTLIKLNRKTRMLYDKRFLYLNGESYRVGGTDAKILRQLADQRSISASAFARLSEPAQDILQEWQDQAWLFFC